MVAESGNLNASRLTSLVDSVGAVHLLQNNGKVKFM